VDKKGFKGELVSWIKDIVDVAVTVVVLIVVLKLLLNSQTLVPLVVVTSSSMVHDDGGWSSWLYENNHNKSMVSDYSFQNGFRRGDMIVTKSPGRYLYFGETGVGDVVIYDRDLAHLDSANSGEPIIHRVVGIASVFNDTLGDVSGTLDCVKEEDFEKYIRTVTDCREGKSCPYAKVPDNSSYNFYITKGDNNPGTDQCGFKSGIALPVTDSQLRARGWIRLPYIGYIKLVFNFVLMLLLRIVTLGRV